MSGIASADNVELAVYDETGSHAADRVGALSDLDGRAGNPLMVTPIRSGEDFFALAVVRAPIDFVRAGVPEDRDRGERTLFVEARGADQGFTIEVLTLHRPPLVFLHGLWSDASAWDDLLLTHDLRYSRYVHNYGPTAAQAFFVNQFGPRTAVEAALVRNRDDRIATTQVDLIAHSMGGVLSRLYLGDPSLFYRRCDNFDRGDFHKLITLNSPHLGSSAADYLVSDTGTPTMIGRLFNLGGQCVDCGAVEDLRTDNPYYARMPAARVPLHLVGGNGGSSVMTQQADQVLDQFDETRPLGFILRILRHLERRHGEPVFRGEHDMIVDRASQEAGMPQGSSNMSLIELRVRPGDPSRTDSIGVHTSVTSSFAEPTIDDILQRCLDASVSSTLFDANGFPPGRPLRGEGKSAEFDAGHAEGGVAGIVFGAGVVLEVTSPPAGATVSAGSLIDVMVPGAPLHPGGVAFVATSQGQTATVVEGEAQLRVPDDLRGRWSLMAFAETEDGQPVITEQVDLEVVIEDATLVGIGLHPEELLLDVYRVRARTEVYAAYDYGDEVREHSLVGLSPEFSIQDPDIAEVDRDGTVTALRIGTTSLTATFEGESASIEVVVTSALGDVDADGDVDEGDAVEAIGCYSGSRAEPGFEEPSLECRKYFDFDRDLDIDRSDLEALSALLTDRAPDCDEDAIRDDIAIATALAPDCNENGVPDACDIERGTSTDGDGDGIPDECEPAPLFLRGDSNADGSLDVSDAVFVLLRLYADGPQPTCDDAADANDSGRIDLSDPVYLLDSLFRGGARLPQPFPECGRDPTGDGLECDEFVPCR